MFVACIFCDVFLGGDNTTLRQWPARSRLGNHLLLFLSHVWIQHYLFAEGPLCPSGVYVFRRFCSLTVPAFFARIQDLALAVADVIVLPVVLVVDKTRTRFGSNVILLLFFFLAHSATLAIVALFFS